jgi:hypothetical protein
LYPQYWAFHARQYAGEEQRRRGAVFGIRAGARDLMQTAPEKTAREEVEGGNAERDRPRRSRRVTMADPRDLVAQAGERFGAGKRFGTGGRQEHRGNIGPPSVRVESEISAR